MDIDENQICIARDNTSSAEFGHYIALLRGDSASCEWPLQKEKGHVIILCDLPFGRKFGCDVDLGGLYSGVWRRCLQWTRYH